MKVRKFSSNLGKVFDPNKDFTSDVAIVLIKHPTSPTEGATVGYVDQKLKEFYKNADIKGTIDDINVIKLEGPEITHTAKELILKNRYSGPEQVVMVVVDNKGRVTKSYPLTSENLDPSVKVDISQVTGRPDTIEGYGIKDLASREKFEKFTVIMTTEKHPRASKGPVPFSRLEEIWQESGYEMGVGDIVVKLKTPDLSKWVKAHSGWVRREDAPLLVTFLAGPDAVEAELPNCKVRDDYILNSFGVPGISYIKASTRDQLLDKDIPIYTEPKNKEVISRGEMSFSRSESDWIVKDIELDDLERIKKQGNGGKLTVNIIAVRPLGALTPGASLPFPWNRFTMDINGGYMYADNNSMIIERVGLNAFNYQHLQFDGNNWWTMVYILTKNEFHSKELGENVYSRELTSPWKGRYCKDPLNVDLIIPCVIKEIHDDGSVTLTPSKYVHAIEGQNEVHGSSITF